MTGSLLATPFLWWTKLHGEFRFTLDVAADDEHHMGNISYITPEQNAFTTPWTGVVWCSPPWIELTLGTWVQRAYLAVHKAGTADTVVMLLPVRPASIWWHELAMKAQEIRFIRGDLNFVPFSKEVLTYSVEPQCLVIFNEIMDSFWKSFGPECSSYPSR